MSKLKCGRFGEKGQGLPLDLDSLKPLERRKPIYHTDLLNAKHTKLKQRTLRALPHFNLAVLAAERHAPPREQVAGARIGGARRGAQSAVLARKLVARVDGGGGGVDSTSVLLLLRLLLLDRGIVCASSAAAAGAVRAFPENIIEA